MATLKGSESNSDKEPTAGSAKITQVLGLNTERSPNRKATSGSNTGSGTHTNGASKSKNGSKDGEGGGGGSIFSTPSRLGDMAGNIFIGNLGDKLVEKMTSAALPTASLDPGVVKQRMEFQKGRPPFSIQLTSKNFRNMNSRTGPIFYVYHVVMSMVKWKNPAATLSMLSVYSFVCLNPRVLPVLPIAFLIVNIMVPAYLSRHPPEPSPLPVSSLIAQGPPLRDPIIPRPVPDWSREFFLNIVDTQNLMADYTVLYDAVSDFLEKGFFFQDEAWSSFVYVALLVAAGAVYILLPFLMTAIPWGVIFIIAGWAALLSSYPSSNTVLKNAVPQEYYEHIDRNVHGAHVQRVEKNVSRTCDLLLQRVNNNWFQETSPPDCREVEVFEVQQYQEEGNVWDSSIYCAKPYIFTRFNLEESPSITSPTQISEILPPLEWVFIGDKKEPKPSNSRRGSDASTTGSVKGTTTTTTTSSSGSTTTTTTTTDPITGSTSTSTSTTTEQTNPTSPSRQSKPPHVFSPESNFNWTLDFYPENWIQAHGVKDLVLMDSDEKWVYDCENGQKVPTIRRRRWYRHCFRQEH